MEAEVCLIGILTPGEEVVCQLGDTLDWQKEEAVNKQKEEVFMEQPPSSSSDSPISIHTDQAGSPEPFTPVTESSQTMHTTSSSSTPGSSQTMVTTKSPMNPSGTMRMTVMGKMKMVGYRNGGPQFSPCPPWLQPIL